MERTPYPAGPYGEGNYSKSGPGMRKELSEEKYIFAYQDVRGCYPLPDVMHTFRTGHRLMVQVQHSWFPLVDRNPQTFGNIGTAEATDFRKATMRLYHDGSHPASIEPPIL